MFLDETRMYKIGQWDRWIHVVKWVVSSNTKREPEIQVKALDSVQKYFYNKLLDYQPPLN